MEVEISTEG